MRLGATRLVPGMVWAQFWLGWRWRFGRSTMYRGIVQRLHLGPLTIAWMPETKPGDRARFRAMQRPR